MRVRPTGNGKYVLSTTATKLLGSNAAAVSTPVGADAVKVGCAADGAAVASAAVVTAGTVCIGEAAAVLAPEVEANTTAIAKTPITTLSDPMSAFLDIRILLTRWVGGCQTVDERTVRTPLFADHEPSMLHGPRR